MIGRYRDEREVFGHVLPIVNQDCFEVVRDFDFDGGTGVKMLFLFEILVSFFFTILYF